MKPETYLKEFKTMGERMLDTTTRKNSDYSGTEDAFNNFYMCEQLGIASAEQGILVRITDKLARAKSLIIDNNEQKVADEKIEDTLQDLAVYAMILAIFVKNKQ